MELCKLGYKVSHKILPDSLLTIFNKHYSSSVALTYFKQKGLKLSVWLDGVKMGKKADIWQYFYYAKQPTHTVLFILRIINSGQFYMMTLMTTWIIWRNVICTSVIWTEACLLS